MDQNPWDKMDLALMDRFMSRYWHSEEGVNRLVNAMTPCQRVLDLACGFGNLSRALRKSGKETYCLDISRRSLVYTREKSGSSYLVQADMNSLPFRACFDGVTNVSSYDGNKISFWCKEVYSVLRPLGIFAVVGVEGPQISGLMGMVASKLNEDVVSGSCPFSQAELNLIGSYESLFGAGGSTDDGEGDESLSVSRLGSACGFRGALEQNGFRIIQHEPLFEGTSFLMVGQKQ